MKFWIKYIFRPPFFFFQFLPRGSIVYDGKNEKLGAENLKPLALPTFFDLFKVTQPFTTAKIQNQPTDKWIKKIWHICTMEYYQQRNPAIYDNMDKPEGINVK